MRLPPEDRLLLESIKANQDTLIAALRAGRQATALRNQNAPAEVGAVIRVDETGSPIVGDTAGTQKLVVFTDFQCPFCVRASRTVLANARLQRAGIRAVIKHYPLEGMHANARDAALAAIVAHRHGAFPQFLEAMNARGENFQPKDLVDILRGILGPGAWADSCKTNETLRQLDLDKAEAEKAGVQGTPTFLLDGKKVSQQALVEGMRK